MVYDTGDPTEPLKSEWFNLKRRDKRWTKDIVGRKKPTRCYEAEHVLEWQLLKSFIEADKIRSSKSRCAFMHKFFINPDFPRSQHRVQVAKDNGKLGKDGKFQFEEKQYDFSDWKIMDQKDPRPIDWIGM